jgi:hypothetical protein
MLGLRPRLKARNSLWELVNKHPSNLHSTAQLPWTQPVEEGADGLPPLPITPTSPLFSRHGLELHAQPVVEEHPAIDMAPVSSNIFNTWAGYNMLNWLLAPTEEERIKAVT